MAEIKAKISEKGQITLPKTIRDILDLNPGDVVRFVLAEGRILVERGKPDMERDLMTHQDTLLADTWDTPEDDAAFADLG